MSEQLRVHERGISDPPHTSREWFYFEHGVATERARLMATGIEVWTEDDPGTHSDASVVWHDASTLALALGMEPGQHYMLVAIKVHGGQP